MAFWTRRRPPRDAGTAEPSYPADEPRKAPRARLHPPLPSFREAVSSAHRSSPESSTRARLRTAFTPAQPVSDARMFAGRRDTLYAVIRALEDRRLHVVLYGDRGMGKTSTLHVLSGLAREVGYIVRYISCSESTEFGDVLRAIVRDVPLLYHADFDPTSDVTQGGGTLADLLPAEPLTVADATDILTRLTGTRMLVVLDEFDRTASTTFRRWIAELIKNLSDRSSGVQLVIAGVAADLPELIQYIPSVRRNIIGLPMTAMADEEVGELVRIGSAVSGLAYVPAALDAIIHAAAGSPYLASLLGQHAGIAAVDRSAASVEAADVATAVERALAEVELRVSPHCLYDLGRVTDPQLAATLDAVAGRSLGHFGKVGNPGTRQHDLDRLVDDYALLERTPDQPGGGYRFRDDSVALLVWLRGIASPSPIRTDPR